MSKTEGHCNAVSEDIQPREEHGWRYLTLDEIQNSPSRRLGFSQDQEYKRRKGYINFLQDAGKELRLGKDTVMTAVIYCHWFYAMWSMQKNDSLAVASAALLLAAKLIEPVLRVSGGAVIIKCWEIVHKPRPTASPAARSKKQKDAKLPRESEGFYLALKEVVYTAERGICGAIGYNLAITSPTDNNLFKQEIRALKLSDNKQYKQLALNFVNDSVLDHTRLLPLRYPPEQIRAAAFHLAAKCCKITLRFPPNVHSLAQFADCSEATLEEIAKELALVYTGKKEDLVELSSGATSPVTPLSSLEPQSSAKAASTTSAPPAEHPEVLSSNSATDVPQIEAQLRERGYDDIAPHAESYARVITHSIGHPSVRNHADSTGLHMVHDFGETTAEQPDAPANKSDDIAAGARESGECVDGDSGAAVRPLESGELPPAALAAGAAMGDGVVRENGDSVRQGVHANGVVAGMVPPQLPAKRKADDAEIEEGEV